MFKVLYLTDGMLKKRKRYDVTIYSILEVYRREVRRTQILILQIYSRFNDKRRRVKFKSNRPCTICLMVKKLWLALDCQSVKYVNEELAICSKAIV